ncbi:GEVED domain-containing protein [Flavobacterium sp.]|uniref:GEVED domain-containing protein n=1 Tax=Flavobacterium sp. TaxID=239 RepID=UPI002B4B0C36|nr:GEVED domain-containing protein [Flavobacterium sp.]HLF52297.1 GEVED domain-containing protein [Flavobacterium sp.]
MKKKFLLKEFNFFTSVKEKQRKTTSFSWMLPILVLFAFLLGNKIVAQTTITISATGTGTFIVPCDVTSITVEVWGGGGAGGGTTVNTAKGGGGGAGGTYVSSTFNSLTGGTVFNYSVGLGAIGTTTAGPTGSSSWFSAVGVLYAQGGAGGEAPNGGTVFGGTGSIATSIGTTKTAGVTGSNGTTTIGGAGGAGGNSGGAGGVSISAGADGNTGIQPGGGGGGAFVNNNTNRNGGNGGNGQIKITYTSTSSTYCTPSFGNGVEPITNVTFAGINNTTTNVLGGSSLENFCITGTVLQGSATNVISIKGNTAGNMPNYIRVYIDWDQNGTFGNVANEIYDLGTITNSSGIDAITLTGNIAVPAAATLGNTKMRVMKKFNAYPTGPCQTGAGYGQAEDYLINITLTSACTTPTAQPTTLSLTPTGSTITGSFTLASPAADKYLVVFNTTGTPPTPVNTTTYTVGGTVSAGNTVVDIDNNNTFTVTGLTPLTLYYIFVFSYNSVCTGGPKYNTTSPLNGSTTTLSGNYCTPTASSGIDGTGITNVSYSTVNYTSSNTTVYNNYTAQTGNVIQGASLPVSIRTATSSYTYNLKIWVDWNNDFDFTDSGEDMYSGTVASTTISASINVPLTATIGNHRMRIGIVWISATPSTPTSCYNGNWAAFEDYTLNITSAAACTLAPVVTGHPSNATIANGGNTTFTATFSNSPASYFWEVSTDGGVNYTTMTNGGVYSGATIATLTITAAPGNMNGYKFRATASNGCGTSAASNPATLTVTTSYCSPSSTTSAYYISGVISIGTLNDASNIATGYSAGGYGNYSSTTIATQIAGAGINININLEGPDSQFVKTYIDWNGDGDFIDANELVYTTGTIATGDTSYGFVVPVNATPGNYRMRIRTRGYTETSTIDPCTTGYSTGETEDYTISIVADCSAKITNVTDGSSCGTGTTTLTAVGSGGGIQFRWYANETGGVPLATTTAGSWTTPSLSSSTTYYVTVYNGSCESLVRMAVRAIINPTTNITFSPSTPIVCGEDAILTIIASGDTTVEDLFSENFEGGTFGGFTLSTTTNLYDTGSDNIPDAPQPNAPWSIKTSTYQPTDTSVWRPAINSGSVGDKFAFTTSDYLYSTIETDISTGNINTANFTDLTLTFKHYYSYYGGDSGKVQVSIDGGANWINVTTYSSDLGSASKFADVTIDLSAYVNVANFRFRYKYTANWDDGWAIDDVRLFGTKPLNTTFTWGGATVDAYIDLACTIPYTGQSITTVYVKPTAGQLINPSWSFTATATLSNGCPVSELITVTNKTKLWQGTTNEWNDPNNWLPAGVPTANDCVIVDPHPFPSTISTSCYQAYGKTLTIKSGGILNVLTDTNITITDLVDVRTGGTFILKNNASLVQINNVANTVNGTFKMERITQPIYRYDYTYWGSPVTSASNFTLGNLSPGSSLRYTWTPSVGGGSGNWTSAAASTAMQSTKGYIVRAPDTFSTNPAVKVPYTANFIGTPNNGDILAPITYGSLGAIATDDKWNLISNPYPSAISASAFLSLASNSSVIDGTIYFWTHNSPPATGFPDPFYGDFVINYTANDYASWNKLGGVGTAASSLSSLGTIPSGFIAAGAAFFVKSLAAPGNATFTNSMRVTDNNNQFFRSTNPTIVNTNNDFEKHRIWLNLTNNSGAFSQILVGYAQGATLGMDRDFDGMRFGGNGVTLYSILPEANLGIQGRPLPFNINDQVPLGYNAAIAGSFSVRIDHIDGLFNTQNIYLEDQLLQVIHNLKLTPYVFTTGVGNFNNRFVLRYTESTLGTDTFEVSNTVKVTVHEKVTVHANQLIKEMLVFDLLGRKIDTYKNIDDTQFILNHLYKTNNVLILKITLENDEVVTEKIIY